MIVTISAEQAALCGMYLSAEIVVERLSRA